MNCPECGAKQDDNGMLAWCNNGHMYKIPKTSPRYDDGTNSNTVLLARARAEAKDEARYSDFEDYCEREGRPNPYSGIDEWSESV